jgi:hypothetical protein
MKAILEFDFDKEDSDDRIQFQDAVDGTKWKLAMWELDQWLRAQIKYAPDTMSDDTHKTLQECRDKLHYILSDNNLNLD